MPYPTYSILDIYFSRIKLWLHVYVINLSIVKFPVTFDAETNEVYGNVSTSYNDRTWIFKSLISVEIPISL